VRSGGKFDLLYAHPSSALEVQQTSFEGISVNMYKPAVHTSGKISYTLSAHTT
jgi:hypothetical protein